MATSRRVAQKREQKRLYKSDTAQAIRNSKHNNLVMQRVPKKPNKSFIAKYDSGECPRCFLSMDKGQRLMYNVDGVLSHARHKHQEKELVICDQCWLTKPCECE